MMKTIYDLIDSLRPNPHKIMADGVALFLARMGEPKDIETRRLVFRTSVFPGQVIRAKQVIRPGVKPREFGREDEHMYEFHKKRHLPWK